MRDPAVLCVEVLDVACRADGRGIDSCGIMVCDGAVAQRIEHRFPN
jgi:hypothetical protein